jgi:hypothetical protein
MPVVDLKVMLEFPKTFNVESPVNLWKRVCHRVIVEAQGRRFVVSSYGVAAFPGIRVKRRAFSRPLQ